MSINFARNPAFLTGGGGGNIQDVSLNFTFNDVSQTSNALRQLAEKISVGVLEALTEVVFEGAAQARSDAPVDTGNLRANIFAEITGKDQVQMHSMAPYSGYVNYGHRTRGSTFVPAQPFFSAAVEYIGQNLTNRINQKMKG
jgi:uncharacterized radical SAM superfamily Fe-S cluster-containing enzyme